MSNKGNCEESFIPERKSEKKKERAMNDLQEEKEEKKDAQLRRMQVLLLYCSSDKMRHMYTHSTCICVCVCVYQ